MKTFLLRTLCALALLTSLCAAQQVIPLYPGAGLPPGSTPQDYPEQQYYSALWKTQVVANVTRPSLTEFKPSPELKNGTAIIVCPGGGMMALSIESEGYDVAQYFAARGVTAFVLKYRLAHTVSDAPQEFVNLLKDPSAFQQMWSTVAPEAVADGLAAVAYVRQHAAELGVNPDRVGIVGFSAGGTVTAGVAYEYKPESRPAFVAPIYAAASMFNNDPVPADAPPMFITVATDDTFHLVPDSIALYQKWTAAHKSAELHIYAKGGHGFGARPHGIPTDHWIDRFAEWLDLEGFMTK